MSDRRQALEDRQDSPAKVESAAKADTTAVPTDGALWQQLLSGSEPSAFVSAFLALQARQLPGTRTSAVFAVEGKGLVPLGVYPAGAPVVDLENLAGLALAEGRP